MGVGGQGPEYDLDKRFNLYYYYPNLGYKDAKMLNLSKTCKYGLQGLVCLIKNQKKGLVKIIDIAKTEGMPYNYLSKIFQKFINSGILISGTGPLGGVRLSPKSYNISLARIIQIIDGKSNNSECPLLGYKNCPRLKSCPIKTECQRLYKSIWRKLRKFKLGDFNNGRTQRVF